MTIGEIHFTIFYTLNLQRDRKQAKLMDIFRRDYATEKIYVFVYFGSIVIS